MSSVNKVFLMGKIIAKEAALELSDGSLKVEAVLRSREHYRGWDGNPVKHDEHHNLLFIDRLAEIADDLLLLDDQICLDGRLQTRRLCVDGRIEFRTEIEVCNFHIIRNRSRERAPAPLPSPAGAPPA